MNLNVTPQELVTTSKLLEQLSTDFIAEVNSMYSTLNELKATWQGQGSDKYYQSISNKEQDIKMIGNVVREYSAFLAKAASIYTSTDGNIASAATKV